MSQAADTPRTAETLMTSKEVAARLRVSINSVHRLADQGHIESIRVGRLRRFAPSAIDAYLQRATQTPKVTPLRAAT